MPLVFLAYLALVAGLALGASWPALAVAIGGAAAVAAAIRHDVASVALGLTLGAGALVAHAATREADACRRRLVAAAAIEAVLDDDAAPGSRAATRDDRCDLPLTLAVVEGHASAGDRVRVRGQVTPTARGAMVRSASIEVVGRRVPLPAARAATGRTLDSLFGADAPLARALVIADVRTLPRELRDRYADAGLVHVLSVSGLHVSLVATALELLLVASRLPRRAAGIAAAVAVALYVAAIGAPAPAVRAGTMLAAGLASRLLQRPTSPWALLALGGTLPLLLDPLAVLDAGYQLSMAGMASLVAGRALGRRSLAPRLEGWRRTVAGELAVSAVASVVTAPVVAWWFGRVSVIGPLANLAAAPIVALLQPALFLAVVLAPFQGLAMHVAGAARLLMRALDAVAAVAAGVPNAALAVSPSVATVVWCVGASVALLVACAARHRWTRARALLAGGGCLAAAAWSPLLPAMASGAMELHMLDVGQGDAIAIRSPRGRWILVDAGRTWRGGDAGRSTVLPYLRRRGGALAAFVLSHPHADHAGGAASVLAAMTPARFWDGAYALGSDVYRETLETARRAGVAWQRVRPGDALNVDGVSLRVLAPDSTWTASLDDPNLASVVLAVRYGEVRFLLVGDAEAAEERWLVDRARDDPVTADALRADVLKVAHHGSRTSSTPEFLDLVRPRVALVSVGAGNTYRHPSPEVVRRFAAGGADVLRTDEWGAIVVRTDGRRMTVDAGGATWIVPVTKQWSASAADSSDVSPPP